MRKKIRFSSVFIQLLLNEKLKLFVLLAAIIASSLQATAADKHAQAVITSWVTGPWYDAATGGNLVSAPVSGDNVFTNGFAVTVNADAACDNLTFLIASVGASVPSQLKVNNGVTLTVRGKIDGTNPPTASTTHVIYDATGAGTIKLTGAALTTAPYVLIGDNAIGNTALNASGIFKPVNVIVEGADAQKVYQIGTLAVGYQHGAGKFTVKSGTTLLSKVYLNFLSSGGTEFLIEEGAEVRAENHVKGIGTASSKAEKVTINGSLKFTNTAGSLNAAILVIGNNGYLKTNRTFTANENILYGGFWHSLTAGGTTLANYGVPSTFTIGTNSTIETAATGVTNQWIQGLLPGTSTSIPYANLSLSGAGTKTIQSNLSFTGTLTIASGVTMVIPSGVTVTVAPGAQITNNGTITNDGTINYLSDATNGTATIIGNGTIGGTGTSTVKQYLTTGRNWYIANPMSTAVWPTVASGTITLNKYDETIVTDAAGATGWTTTTDPLDAGKGYVATVSVNGNITFAGTLNSGNQNIALTSRTGTANKAGFNLVGNPYPSYLDWSLVTANIPNANLLRSTTLWYRTKKLNQAEQLVYQFQTVNGDGISVPNNGNAKIPPMQSFWVRAAEGVASPIVVTNAMRSHAPATDKLLKAPSAKNVNRTLVRLQVSNGVNTDDAVVYFSENAQNGLDNLDAPKMSNGNAAIPEIYSTLGTEKIVINSMKTILLDAPIGIGFTAGSATSFSIKANEISNIPAGVKVILKDNVTLAETDITDATASYNFNPEETSTDRFSLLFRSPDYTTGLNATEKLNAQVYVNSANQITIIAPAKCNYNIYNAVGQKISEGITKENQTTTNLQKGVYVVKVSDCVKELTTKVIAY